MTIKSHQPSLFIFCAIVVGLTGLLATKPAYSTRVLEVFGGVLALANGKVQSGALSPDHGYHAQIFSRDPLIIYIRDFLDQMEIEHLLGLSEGNYEPSKVYPGDQELVDTYERVSESALIKRDAVVKNIERRARRFQGYRGSSVGLQPLKTQRYGVNSFFNYHYDWDPLVKEGNRVTTFMVYIVDNCTGGGTNFPRLEQPEDPRWCDVTVCDEDERDGYPGVIFKPIAGAAVFWENMHINGSFHRGVRHAALPVKSGEKVGLNIWSWDYSWRMPELDSSDVDA